MTSIRWRRLPALRTAALAVPIKRKPLFWADFKGGINAVSSASASGSLTYSGSQNDVDA